MRYVNRSSIVAPASLAIPAPAQAQEMADARTYYQSYDPTADGAAAYPFKEYKPFEVQATLRHLFHNKCAYCETEISNDLDVEHFRPKGAVAEDRLHHGYWWLAHTWNNLLASCQHCNQKRKQHILTEDLTEVQFLALEFKEPSKSYGKLDHFPIEGVRATYTAQDLSAERPLLIDPTAEDPTPYFKWFSKGVYSIVLADPSDQWRASRALTSISIFALNRMRLVQARTVTLNELKFHKEQILAALEEDARLNGASAALEKALTRIRSLKEQQADTKPYTAMTKAFWDDFRAELANSIMNA